MLAFVSRNGFTRCRGIRFAAIAILFIALTASVSTTASAGTEFFGPTPYLSLADSPFDLSRLGTTLYVENFESGQISTPGLTISNGQVRGPSSLTDSVDGDTGAVDGNGNDAHSYLVRPGSQGTTIFFDPQVFGRYPTHVGLVSTDGYGQNGAPANTVVFFDPSGQLVGILEDPIQNFNVNTTDDDRFLGVYHPAGISRIYAFNLGTGSTAMEIDHIHYGVPEPTTLTLLASGVALMMLFRLRKRR